MKLRVIEENRGGGHTAPTPNELEKEEDTNDPTKCSLQYKLCYNTIIIIGLLTSPLLGHRPSLWIPHEENGP
jgi:hypothetical protein